MVTGLELTGLTVGHRRHRATGGAVLAGVDAVAGRGELTVLLGRNGAGKSTLLRTLAGLQPALAGAARLDDEDLLALPAAQRARRVGVVLTDRPDPGLLTGRDVVELGRLPHTGPDGLLGPGDEAAVGDALAAVRAEPLAGRRVSELSDGERQRLMVARALAQAGTGASASLLLLDEPSAFLDVAARVALLGLLRRLARERGLCVVLSTHDLEPALRLADAVWLIDGDGDHGDVVTGTPDALAARGAIGAAFDTPELVFDPASGAFHLRAGT